MNMTDLSLPLQFGNTSSSHSSYHIEGLMWGYYGFEQDRTNVVDGWDRSQRQAACSMYARENHVET